ncbi:MAG: TolC family protein [Planctomycetota bacterium]
MPASRAGHVILIALAAWAVTGCAPSHYKAQADRDVYAAIDRKWPDDAGGRKDRYVADVDPTVHEPPTPRALPGEGVLTLADAVAVALDHNRPFQAEKDLLYLAGLNETFAAYQFAPHPLVSLAGFFRRDRFSEGPDQTSAGVEAAGAFQQVLSTGATVSADVLTGWIQVLSGEGSEGFHTLANATVVQPLLRGFGRDVVLEPLTQARRDTLYQIRTYSRARRALAARVMAEYYQVLELLAVADSARANHEAMAAHAERMANLANAGRVTEYEALDARQDRVEAHNDLLEARRDYETMLDAFKQTLGIPTVTEIRLNPAELHARWSLDLLDLERPEAAAIDLALAYRLDLANRRDRIDDAQRHVEVAADALGPGLSLVATGGVTSSSADNSFPGTDFDDTFSLALRFDAPLDRLLERNDYRTALLEVLQRRREYDEGVQLVALEVRRALRDLQTAAERRRVLEDQLAPAMRRLQSATKLLQYGRANVEDVLDAQQDLFDLQVELADARTDYATAVVNLYRDTGVLHVHQDGQCDGLQRPAPQTAPADDPVDARGDDRGDDADHRGLPR